MSLQIDELHPLILNVGLAVHNADWNWKDVSSPFMRIFYVTEGNAELVMPHDNRWQLKPGHLYLIPSFAQHSYVCNSHFSLYYLHIYEEHQHETGILDEWDFPTEIPADDLSLPLIKRLCQMNPHMSLSKSDPTSYDNNSTLIQNLLTNKRRPFCDKVESRGIVFQLLSYFLRRAVPKGKIKDDRIEEALTYIRKHIYEDINLEYLAEQACLSKDHFIRLFKQETGETPLKYINQKKIEKAQLILVTDEMSVKNVAFTLSFEDYSYFNRLFKKMTGLTPQEYRNHYH